jgi:hypothetical protein
MCNTYRCLVLVWVVAALSGQVWCSAVEVEGELFSCSSQLCLLLVWSPPRYCHPSSTDCWPPDCPPYSSSAPAAGKRPGADPRRWRRLCGCEVFSLAGGEEGQWGEGLGVELSWWSGSFFCTCLPLSSHIWLSFPKSCLWPSLGYRAM